MGRFAGRRKTRDCEARWFALEMPGADKIREKKLKDQGREEIKIFMVIL
ncbi:MAG: hypothetical protein ACTMUB_04435 [cyanobacterium endosymbiont of Rhopalodia musculus]|nr:hypothetical protein [cyanobacterium endosymbiont of Epithemia clementina EcSB]WGT67422.1 hypothetical protein P3F56_09545 [cyanobacterium endosymbiont of Epithemia clementina EcSB]